MLSRLAIVAILGSVRSGSSRAYAQWSTTNFVVTNDRVIFRTGVFAKSGIEIPLRPGQQRAVHTRAVFERILGAGDLMIESGGETGQQRFTDVRIPSVSRT